MTKLKSIVVIPKLWSGHFLCVRVGVCGVSDDPSISVMLLYDGTSWNCGTHTVTDTRPGHSVGSRCAVCSAMTLVQWPSLLCFIFSNY